MLLTKLRIASVPLFAGLALGLGAIAVARQAPEKGQILEVPAAKSATARVSQEPGVLKLFGTVRLVPETVLQVHAPCDGRVDEVYVFLGSSVKVGDPLLAFSSTDLAGADNEPPSRLMANLAKDKLLVYDLSEAEIEKTQHKDRPRRAKVILHARHEAIVIKRNAVLGNQYSANDVLLAMARHDRIQIIAATDPSNAEKLRIGQRLTVNFPYEQKTAASVVEAISPPDVSGKVTIRTTVLNPEGRMKPGAFARLDVDLGPAGLSLDERLTLVEQKLDKLLGANDRRSPEDAVLKRLTELERKLDRVLNLRPGN